MDEIWKDIKGYEGLYKISSLGRIKRLERVIVNSIGKKITLKEKILNGTKRNGYYCFNAVGNNGENLKQGVHIFVAQAFPEICGEWFEGCHVHHIDHNPLNNTAENLQVMKAEEHLSLHNKGENNNNYDNHNKKPNISKALIGRRNECKHIPILQYTKNGVLLKEWECIADVQKELGYSAGNICWVCKGICKTAYGFVWRYKNNGDSNEPPIL